MKRIHIVGASHRTGTTLLTECMRLCFCISDCEEHEAPLTKMRWSKSVYLTKDPNDILYMRPRLYLDPRLFIICMMRDPRDVVVSRHMAKPYRYFRTLEFWKYRNRIVQKFRHHPRFIVIKYEDLIADPNSVQDYLMSRISGLKKTKPFSDFYKGALLSDKSELALNGLRPIDSNNTCKWRNHMPRLREQVEVFGPISDELIQNGYEEGDDWLCSSIQNGKSSDNRIRSHIKNRKRFLTYPISAAVAGLCSLCRINFG